MKNSKRNLDKCYTRDKVSDLITQTEQELESATYYLAQAREITTPYGLAVDSSILNPAYQTPLIPSNKLSTINSSKNEFYPHHLNNFSSSSQSKLLPNVPPILSTTGGHSNTDHLVLNTGHAQLDRIAELKRNLKRRARAMQPECKGEDRWDQPRISGQGVRRRRITREADLPHAPPEPPLSGYILFLAQMTAKIKHDAIQRRRIGGNQIDDEDDILNDEPQHDQIKVVREISKIWRFGLKSEEKQYYLDFAMSAKLEYNYQIREFRATGGYTPSSTFMKLGEGPWVRKIWHEKSELERELATYPMEIFKLKQDKRLTTKKSNSKKYDNDENNLIAYDFISRGTLHENSMNKNIESEPKKSKIEYNEPAEMKEDKDNVGEDDDEYTPSDDGYS